MTHKDPETRRARVLERRAARERRSKWLGRLLFSLTGMGLVVLLRMHPGIVEDAVRLAYGHPPAAQNDAIAAADDTQVRQMPKDVVPVRRGGALPQTSRTDIDTQAQADDVANSLRSLAPGG
ncbi:MAG: hypothetical protein AAGF36_14955 [Pseudomonadota bacterium]